MWTSYGKRDYMIELTGKRMKLTDPNQNNFPAEMANILVSYCNCGIVDCFYCLRFQTSSPSCAMFGFSFRMGFSIPSRGCPSNIASIGSLLSSEDIQAALVRLLPFSLRLAQNLRVVGPIRLLTRSQALLTFVRQAAGAIRTTIKAFQRFGYLASSAGFQVAITRRGRTCPFAKPGGLGTVRGDFKVYPATNAHQLSPLRTSNRRHPDFRRDSAGYRAMQPASLPIRRRPYSKGDATVTTGTMYRHRDTPRCQTPGVRARRGHFMSPFYHSGATQIIWEDWPA